jgi:hypothetical protein
LDGFGCVREWLQVGLSWSLLLFAAYPNSETTAALFLERGGRHRQDKWVIRKKNRKNRGSLKLFSM